MISKQAIDIEDKHADIVVKALKKYLPEGAYVYVFGSRATWQARRTSDLDLAIDIQDADKKYLDSLEEELRASDLPYKVDIININAISQSFRNAIASTLVPLLWDWRICPLGEVVEVIGGGTPNTSIAEYWNGDIPWLSIADFNTNKKYVYNTEKFITNEGLQKSSTVLLEIGDIIISARGTVGAIATIKSRMAFNQSCYGIRAKKGICNSYLFYLLRKAVSNLKKVANGGVFDTIIRSNLEQLEIHLPQLKEQEAIAEVLSSLDDKIDLLHRQNTTLEAMAQALFRHYFIDNAQDDWEEVSLGEVADIAIGRTPPRKDSQWFSKSLNDIKWISIKDLGTSGLFILDTAEKLTCDAGKKFNIPIIPQGTVVLSFKMTIGRVAITSEDMFSNEAIAHFKIKEASIITKEFLYFFLKQFKYEMLGTTSSIVTSINSEMIKELSISIPDRSSIDKFQKQSISCFEKIKTNQKQIQTLQNLRDTLLPKLVNGDVRVGMGK